MSDDDLSPGQKQVQSDWRSGRTSAQKQAALNAKATLDFLKQNPGSTKADVMSAGIRPNFFMLQQHGLAYFTGGGKKSLLAQWYAKGFERREP
jgi:hypothetical protein